MARTGAFRLQESNLRELTKALALFIFFYLQRLARCEKDDGPQKAKIALWVNPYFLHELPKALALFV
jgi:hypothetical protein